MLLLGSVHSQTSQSLCVKKTSSSTPVGYLRHRSRTSLCVRRRNIFTRQQPLKLQQSQNESSTYSCIMKSHEKKETKELSLWKTIAAAIKSKNQTKVARFSFLLDANTRARNNTVLQLGTNLEASPENGPSATEFFKMQGQNMKICRERTRSDKCLYRNVRSILHALDP